MIHFITFSSQKRESVCFNVLSPEHKFTGREKELKLLHEALQRNLNSPKNIESQITVVSGLGGIGKTQLVRQYVQENQAKYDNNVIWINADREESIIDAFKRLANDILLISTVGANGNDKNINSVVQDVYDYFCGKQFLFVYDNVESMEIIRKFLLIGSSKPNTRPYILMTSRDQDWHAGIEVIRLDEWQLSEAIDFVSIMLENTQDNENMRLLVQDLQCFPLALRQATSYIVNKMDTISNYRAKYEKQKKGLLDSKLFQNAVGKYTETTFTTWNITMKTIEQDREFGSLAMKILNTIAYFSPDNIHRASLIALTDESKESTGRVLSKYFIQLVVSEVFNVPNSSLTHKSSRKKLVSDKEELLESAVRLLIKYSMISSQARHTILSIHRVVQDVIKVTLKGNGQEKKVLRNALLLMEKLMKRVDHTAHAVVVFQHALDYPDVVREFCELPNTILMNLVTNFMKDEAVIFVNKILEKFETIVRPNHATIQKIKFNFRYSRAVMSGLSLMSNDTGYLMYEQLYEIRVQELGEANVDTLLVKFEIGQILFLMGKTAEAFSILEEVNRKYEITLGYAHRETIASEEIIAVLYMQVGLHEEALKRLKLLHCKKRSVFGDCHRKTLFTMNLIGTVLILQQKYTHALEVFEEAYKNSIDLGEEHEIRLKTMVNMANAHSKLGNYDEAIQTYKDVYKIKVKILGQNHDETLSSLHDLGVVLLDHWNCIEAIEIFNEICNHTGELGEDSVITFTAMKNMALAYGRLGNYETAEEIYKKVHLKRTEMLGKNHTDTLSALNDIGELLLDQNKYYDALNIFEEIDKSRIELGLDNQIILKSMSNIAYVHCQLDNNAESLKVFKVVHEKTVEKLGENHPDTLAVLIQIADVLTDEENHSEALLIYEDIYKRRTELGEEQLIIRVVKSKIAFAYARTGNYTEALRILKEVYTKSTEIGENHPATLCALYDIGKLYMDQKNYSEALTIYRETNEKAMKISENNEHVIISMRNMAFAHLQLGNFKESLQIYIDGHTRNIKIFEENHIHIILSYIRTAIELVEQGKCAEAFVIFQNIYKNKISLKLEHENVICSIAKEKIGYLYDKLRAIHFIQKHSLTIN